jgi:acetylornithine deacetylase/succinyl-diaminopimelate desuccinylase-like protein
MKYYMERTKLPEYNVVLDSKYPAVVAEKGTGALTVRFPMRVTDDNGIAVVALSAAAPANAIPQTARATIKGADLTTAVAALEAARAGFISKYETQGGSFGDRLEVTANVRMPRGRTPDELKSAIVARIDAWEASNKIPLDITYNDWMARDPKGAWLAALLDIFGDVTGLEAKQVPTAGSTTAKLLPNAINFGPAMPGKKYTAHNAKSTRKSRISGVCRCLPK